MMKVRGSGQTGQSFHSCHFIRQDFYFLIYLLVIDVISAFRWPLSEGLHYKLRVRGEQNTNDDVQPRVRCSFTGSGGSAWQPHNHLTCLGILCPIPPSCPRVTHVGDFITRWVTSWMSCDQQRMARYIRSFAPLSRGGCGCFVLSRARS